MNVSFSVRCRFATQYSLFCYKDSFSGLDFIILIFYRFEVGMIIIIMTILRLWRRVCHRKFALVVGEALSATRANPALPQT